LKPKLTIGVRSIRLNDPLRHGGESIVEVEKLLRFSPHRICDSGVHSDRAKIVPNVSFKKRLPMSVNQLRQRPGGDLAVHCLARSLDVIPVFESHIGCNTDRSFLSYQPVKDFHSTAKLPTQPLIHGVNLSAESVQVLSC